MRALGASEASAEPLGGIAALRAAISSYSAGSKFERSCIKTPEETSAKLEMRSDFAGAKIALSFFPK